MDGFHRLIQLDIVTQCMICFLVCCGKAWFLFYWRGLCYLRFCCFYDFSYDFHANWSTCCWTNKLLLYILMSAMSILQVKVIVSILLLKQRLTRKGMFWTGHQKRERCTALENFGFCIWNVTLDSSETCANIHINTTFITFVDSFTKASNYLLVFSSFFFCMYSFFF